MIAVGKLLDQCRKDMVITVVRYGECGRSDMVVTVGQIW